MQRSQQELASLQNESFHIEVSCARDFGINKRMLEKLRSPVKLTVFRRANANVKCFARCMIDRFGYYQYSDQGFDIERLVEISTATGLTENHTRYYADKCIRIAWLGEENCEDFWNVYRCFHGSV